MTDRELMYRTLAFDNKTGHISRDLWELPYAQHRYPEGYAKIKADYPSHIATAPKECGTPSPVMRGDIFAEGTYVDEWGCAFESIQAGIVGECKAPIVTEEDWSDWKNVTFPEDQLTFDRDLVNRFCESSGQFVLSGGFARPFEQLQFIRGTENLYIDLVTRPPLLTEFIKRMHDYYCRMLTAWGQTDVDALYVMDDWGAQKALLINPALWREMFKPLYRDYVAIARQFGKKLFFHSDGHIEAIYPDFVELGVDALNSQLFCMDFEVLSQYRGKITFWGEIDRQNLLAYGTLEDIDNAVDKVMQNLWCDGGVIAQCSFDIGPKPDNVYRVYQAFEAHPMLRGYGRQ